MVEDYRPDKIRYSRSNLPIEIDVYVPHLKIGFEYQGAQHYIIKTSLANYERIVQKDREKVLLCNEHGVRLVIIPYWTPLTIQSISSFLKDTDLTVESFRAPTEF